MQNKHCFQSLFAALTILVIMLIFVFQSFSADCSCVLSKVWPTGKTVFPDFLLPRTADIWEELIVKHSERIRFDGLWIVSSQYTRGFLDNRELR